MIYQESNDINQSCKNLFNPPWNHILDSVLSGFQGSVLVDRSTSPQSALAIVGKGAPFAFLGGQVNEDLWMHLPKGDLIMVPQSSAWSNYLMTIKQHEVSPFIRYAMQAPQKFNRQRINQMKQSLADSYSISVINQQLFNQCLEESWSKDLVSNFDNYQDFCQQAMGFVVLNQGKIISGASTFLPLANGIEIEVDTHPRYQGQGLATIGVSYLINACLDREWYPSWDAHTAISRDFSKKFGYSVSFDYQAFEWK